MAYKDDDNGIVSTARKPSGSRQEPVVITHSYSGISSDTHHWHHLEIGCWFKVVGESTQNGLLIVELVGSGGNPDITYAHPCDFKPKCAL